MYLGVMCHDASTIWFQIVQKIYIHGIYTHKYTHTTKRLTVIESRWQVYK